MMKLDQSAFFQGKFRVFICESNFEGGIFQNTLSMSRFKEQENDKKSYLGVKDPISNVFIPSESRGPTALSQGKKLAGSFYDTRRPDTLNVIHKKKNSSNNHIGNRISANKLAKQKKLQKRLNSSEYGYGTSPFIPII